MANNELLKASIRSAIKANGNEEITGDVLQQTLVAIVDALGKGYQFMGVATPATDPGTTDQKVFYIANGKGVYTNFGGINVDEDGVVLLVYSDAWTKLLVAVNLVDGSVTTPKIANSAVTEEKIADGSITGDKFSPGLTLYMNKQFTYLKQVQVQYGEDPSTAIKSFAQRDNKTALYIKLTNGLLVPANTNGETVSGLYSYGNTVRKVLFDGTNWSDVEIQSDIIDTAHIKDGAVISIKIADNTVTSMKIDDGAVIESKLSDNLIYKVNNNVKTIAQTLTDDQKAQARKNIAIPSYVAFDSARQLTSDIGRFVKYFGESDTIIDDGLGDIKVDSNILEIDFCGATLETGHGIKGHERCKIKNLTIRLTTNSTAIEGFGYVENVYVTGGENNIVQYGFRNCDHLYNCKCDGYDSDVRPGARTGFSYCNYLFQCRYSGWPTNTNCVGFEHCNFISQCYMKYGYANLTFKYSLGSNRHVESLIGISYNGDIPVYETFADTSHIRIGDYNLDNFIKLISSSGGTGKTKLYAKPDDKPGMATVLMDTSAVNWAVARRTATGTLKAKDAVEDDDLVSLKQLNAAIAELKALIAK